MPPLNVCGARPAFLLVARRQNDTTAYFGQQVSRSKTQPTVPARDHGTDAGHKGLGDGQEEEEAEEEGEEGEEEEGRGLGGMVPAAPPRLHEGAGGGDVVLHHLSVPVCVVLCMSV
jgi:hypothetical protein